jgi:biopolymer transport protein ExbD
VTPFGPEDETELRAELNVTPLVDVMLVLLVIFMVVAPRLAHDIPVELPVAEQARPATDTAQVTLTVLADGTLRLNGTPVASDGLVGHLQAIYAERVDHTIFVEADRALTHGRVVEVLDDCRAAGVSRIGMVTANSARAGGT